MNRVRHTRLSPARRTTPLGTRRARIHRGLADKSWEQACPWEAGTGRRRRPVDGRRRGNSRSTHLRASQPHNRHSSCTAERSCLCLGTCPRGTRAWRRTALPRTQHTPVLHSRWRGRGHPCTRACRTSRRLARSGRASRGRRRSLRLDRPRCSQHSRLKCPWRARIPHLHDSGAAARLQHLRHPHHQWWCWRSCYSTTNHRSLPSCWYRSPPLWLSVHRCPQPPTWCP